MDELPVELLAQIVDYCDHYSRKQLRCINKIFHDLATPLIFDEVYVATFKHSLAKFTSIASCHLAKHVRKLVFFNDMLPKYTQIQWERSICNRPDFRWWRAKRAHRYPDEPRLGNNSEAMIGGIFARAREEYDQIPRHLLTKQELKAGWQAYRRYYREQESWTDYRESWKFQSAFCELPNVQEVLVANATYNDRNFNSRPFWRRFYRDTYIGPDSWKRGYAGGVIADEHLFEITEKATLCVYEAMARRHEQGSSPIVRLKIQHLMQNESTLANNWRKGRRQPRDLKRHSHLQVPQRLWLAKPFAHLTDFSLRLDSNESVDRCYISEQIHQLLIEAQELRRLVLTLEHPSVAGIRSFDEEDHEAYSGEFEGEYGDPHYSGEACLLHATSVIWPKIEHLAISVPFCAKKFIRFLKLHSSTLRSLEFHQALVYDVPTLLEQIPKVVHLDHVYIKTLVHIGTELRHPQYAGPFDKAWFLADSTDFDAPYEQSMKAYLLGKSPAMPDLLEDHFGRLCPQDRTDRTGTEPVNTIFYPSTFRELDYVKLESPTPEDVLRAGTSFSVD